MPPWYGVDGYGGTKAPPYIGMGWAVAAGPRPRPTIAFSMARVGADAHIRPQTHKSPPYCRWIINISAGDSHKPYYGK